MLHDHPDTYNWFQAEAQDVMTGVGIQYTAFSKFVVSGKDAEASARTCSIFIAYL